MSFAREASGCVEFMIATIGSRKACTSATSNVHRWVPAVRLSQGFTRCAPSYVRSGGRFGGDLWFAARAQSRSCTKCCRSRSAGRTCTLIASRPTPASTGVYRDGGTSFATDAFKVRLCDLHLRRLEHFTYEYGFGDVAPQLLVTLDHTPRNYASGKNASQPLAHVTAARSRREPKQSCRGPNHGPLKRRPPKNQSAKRMSNTKPRAPPSPDPPYWR